MTNQEARMMLEVWATNATGESATGNEYAIRSVEALDMAIEALEKQIPKKPVVEKSCPLDTEELYLYYYCPVCNSRVPLFSKPKDRISIYGKPSFCRCGQAIDWSGEND